MPKSTPTIIISLIGIKSTFMFTVSLVALLAGLILQFRSISDEDVALEQLKAASEKLFANGTSTEEMNKEADETLRSLRDPESRERTRKKLLGERREEERLLYYSSYAGTALFLFAGILALPKNKWSRLI